MRVKLRPDGPAEIVELFAEFPFNPVLAVIDIDIDEGEVGGVFLEFAQTVIEISGNNVGLGRDYTIFAKIDGIVAFERFGKKRKKVSVYAA